MCYRQWCKSVDVNSGAALVFGEVVPFVPDTQEHVGKLTIVFSLDKTPYSNMDNTVLFSIFWGGKNTNVFLT